MILLVDMLSRKAWAYVLTKSKQEKRAEVSVKTQEFKDEVVINNVLQRDKEYSSTPNIKNCEDNDIRLDTSVAKEEHISNGNKIGIIDRLVRTLTGHRTDNIRDVIQSIIDNSSSHRTLKNKTPNQVFKDNDDQTARHLNDRSHNQQVHKSVPFDTGDKVRIVQKKEKINKESRNSVKKYIHQIRRMDTNYEKKTRKENYSHQNY